MNISSALLLQGAECLLCDAESLQFPMEVVQELLSVLQDRPYTLLMCNGPAPAPLIAMVQDGAYSVGADPWLPYSPLNHSSSTLRPQSVLIGQLDISLP